MKTELTQIEIELLKAPRRAYIASYEQLGDDSGMDEIEHILFVDSYFSPEFSRKWDELSETHKGKVVKGWFSSGEHVMHY
jgi:hypothetical protein